MGAEPMRSLSMLVELVRSNFLRYRMLWIFPVFVLSIASFIHLSVYFFLQTTDLPGPTGFFDDFAAEGGLIIQNYLIYGEAAYAFAALTVAAASTWDDRHDNTVLFWISLPVPLWLWILAIPITLLVGFGLVFFIALFFVMLSEIIALVGASVFLGKPTWALNIFPTSWHWWTPLLHALWYWSWQTPLFLFFMLLGCLRLRSPALLGMLFLTVAVIAEVTVPSVLASYMANLGAQSAGSLEGFGASVEHYMDTIYPPSWPRMTEYLTNVFSWLLRENPLGDEDAPKALNYLLGSYVVAGLFSVLIFRLRTRAVTMRHS